jgi:N-methylhydantoinase A
MEYPFDPEELTERYESLEAELREEGFEDVTVERHADIRFGWQVHELAVPVPDGNLNADDVDRMTADFEEKYESRYGKGAGYSEAEYELAVSWCSGVGRTRSPAMQEPEATDETPTAGASRDVFWVGADRQVATDVYYPDAVGPGMALDGPAVVQMTDTTIAVPPGASCEVDAYGNFVIDTGA